MKDFQYITNAHPAYIENLYNDFVKDPASVDGELRKFFEGFDFAVSHAGSNGNGASNGAGAPAATATETIQFDKEIKVYQLLQAYRRKGHLVAKTNPVRERKDRKANLTLENFGLSEADLSSSFEVGKFVGLGRATLGEIVSKMQKCYTTHLGVEFRADTSSRKLDWMMNAVEDTMLQPVPLEQQKRILQKLNEGVMFEKFLHTKYIGQKRFSLEGGETTIAALDAIIDTASQNTVQEVVIGMAHREGSMYSPIYLERLTSRSSVNLKVRPLRHHDGKRRCEISPGYSSDIITASGNKINLKLCPNPSHLEAVDPVVVGFSRCKADVMYNSDFDKILPILIHGDASIAGQGVVYEVLQMSGLKGYYTGGTIHFVINNQIGFTTDFDDARSADYCTSIAAMVKAPVLHVNGDDPETVVKAVQIATQYRQKFNSDIFIDMVCYRKHGHNEGDEPKFTPAATLCSHRQTSQPKGGVHPVPGRARGTRSKGPGQGHGEAIRIRPAGKVGRSKTKSTALYFPKTRTMVEKPSTGDRRRFCQFAGYSDQRKKLYPIIRWPDEMAGRF
jgi:2-oxoglutarate dehydrogenase E1 component